MTWIELSQWMAKLYHPLQPGHRQQIRDRASQQKRQMTIKSVQKTTQKKTSVFWQSLTYIIGICGPWLNIILFQKNGVCNRDQKCYVIDSDLGMNPTKDFKRYVIGICGPWLNILVPKRLGCVTVTRNAM